MKTSVVLCFSSPCLQTEIIFIFQGEGGECSSFHEIANFAVASTFFLDNQNISNEKKNLYFPNIFTA